MNPMSRVTANAVWTVIDLPTKRVMRYRTH